MEAAEYRVVDSAVHVDKAEVVQLFVGGEAVVAVVVDVGVVERFGGTQQADAIAPGVIPILNNGGATGIADADNGAQMVFMEVDRFIGARALTGVLGYRGAACVDGVLAFDYAVVGLYFVMEARIDTRIDKYR